MMAYHGLLFHITPLTQYTPLSGYPDILRRTAPHYGAMIPFVSSRARGFVPTWPVVLTRWPLAVLNVGIVFYFVWHVTPVRLI